MAASTQIAMSDNWLLMYYLPGSGISLDDAPKATIKDICQDMIDYANKYKQKIFPAQICVTYFKSVFNPSNFDGYIRGHIYIQNTDMYTEFNEILTGLFTSDNGIFAMRMHNNGSSNIDLQWKNLGSFS